MSRAKSFTEEEFIKNVHGAFDDQESIDAIKHAFDYAKEKHDGQFRKSGEPYFIHLVNVGAILLTLNVHPTTIQAGLLHDVIEDSGVSFEELKEEFGTEIAEMVEAVSKIGNIQFKDEKEYLAENHRKIFIAMAKDVRVILIKLVDRLHNMRTLEFQPEYKQKKISQETLSVYAPIAHRLGINEIKTELEDLSFMYLHREKYYDIVKLVDARKIERDEQVQTIIKEISLELDEHSIPHRIFGRSKHLYSIYKKMNKQHKRFDEILDLLAIRIITESEVQCYEILGYIHARYKPIPGRLKDYIAMPKVNLYQSLHTTIVSDTGHIYEVQIRTEEMDLVAERGIAAHWRYKEGKRGSQKQQQKEIEDKLVWLKDFSMLTDENDQSAQQYMEVLQKDVFEANVYVMTPKGRVIDLPTGSTPIDFAYRIHTEVGHSTIGSTVNDVLVPLNTKLKTGDVVNIKTSKNSTGPSEDWLGFVQTNHARNKIRNFLQKQELQNREAMITKGEQMLKEELKKRRMDDKEFMTKHKLEPLFEGFNIKNYDDFMYAISVKSLSLQAVLEKLETKPKSIIDFNKLFGQKPKPKTSSRSGIKVSGIDTMKISLANCCSPVPGDDIVGYITKGQGVKVHRTDCPNIRYETKRLIDVEWDDESITGKFEVQLSIYCVDRTFLLTDVVTLTQQNKITITFVNAQIDDDLIHSTITLKVMVENQSQLRQLMVNLRKIDSVVSVERSIL